MAKQHKIFGYYTTLAIVVANMVGTGVFTTLGLQAIDIHSGFALIFAWVLGGLIALCGALSYGELAAAMPKSGGEYHFLTKIYHPLLGLMAGWVSVTVGFSAPIALAAMALGRYAATITHISPMITAVLAILIVTVIHAFNVRTGQIFHIVTTILKLIVIISFCAVGILAYPIEAPSWVPNAEAITEIFTANFALSLIYVSYAFSGWNAATYVASEVSHPQRNIPRSLLHGVGLVTLLYLLLNYVFLRTIPVADLSGKIEVGALSADYLFGPQGSAVISVVLCLLLISTISAMVLAGPRVVQRIGEDFPALKLFAARTSGDAPMRAILLQQVIALGFVFTNSFESVLAYAGFTLNVFTLLTVLGVIVLRYTSPGLHRPYRVWGYPLTPLLFIVLSSIALLAVFETRPLAAAAGVATVLIGLGLGLLQIKRSQ